MYDFRLCVRSDFVPDRRILRYLFERFIIFKNGGEIVRFLSFGIAKYLVDRDKPWTGCHYMIVSSKTGEVLYEL